MGVLETLEATGVGVWVRESYLGYPIVLTAHSIGMGMVVGIVYILSLRVLGFARRLPITAFDTLLTVAWIGFFINALSGVLLFCGNASHLAVNLAFQLKLLFIIAGGVSIWALWRTIDSGRDGITADGSATAKAKSLALVNLGFWTAAIVAGRLIGYTIKYF